MEDRPVSDVLILKSTPEESFHRRFVMNRVRYVIVLAVIVLCEFFILVRFRRVLFLFFYPYLKPPNLLWLLLILLLVFYVTLIIHECGHVLSARLVRFRFLLLIAGPLKIERTRHRIRIGLNKSMRVFDGLAAGIPLDAHHLRRRDLIFNAGGPLANFLQAIIFAACSFWPGFALYPAVPVMLRLTAGIALAFSVTNFIPLRVAGRLTDGAGILLLLKGGRPLERWYATTVLWMGFAQGLLPREWNPDLLRMAMSLPDSTTEDVAGCSYGYYWSLDSGDIAGARLLLERMLAARRNIPTNLRRLLALEAAYFEARYHHNAKAARAWFERTKGITDDRCSKLRAEAAVLLAEGKKEKARVCIQKGLATVQDALYIGTERIEEAWLRDLLGLLEG